MNSGTTVDFVEGLRIANLQTHTTPLGTRIFDGTSDFLIAPAVLSKLRTSRLMDLKIYANLALKEHCVADVYFSHTFANSKQWSLLSPPNPSRLPTININFLFSYLHSTTWKLETLEPQKPEKLQNQRNQGNPQ